MRTLSSRLHALIHHLSLHDQELSFDTAMVLGGGAFRHYFFTPDDNHAWLVEHPDEHWRDDTVSVENYGLYEAVGGHTGWDSRQWTGLSGAELVQLLRYERENARLIRQEATDAHPAGIIRSFDVGRDGVSLHIERGDETITLSHNDLSTIDDFAASLPPLQTLRPQAKDVPLTRRHALSADVFRWAPRHWHAHKEILFDVQAFYAAGDRAWEKLRDFAQTQDTFDAPRQTNARTYIQTHLSELGVARRAAAAFFGDPAEIVEHTGLPITAAPVVDALAAAWHASAEAIDTASDASSDALVSSIEEAHQRDKAAFEQFEAWLP